LTSEDLELKEITNHATKACSETSIKIDEHEVERKQSPVTELPPPTTASNELESWNNPPGNSYRLFACFYAFIMFGINDAAYGPLIPLLERYYDLTYTVVSLIFLSPFAGYTLAASLNSTIHMHFGQRGIAVLAPICHLIPYLIISFHPPYPVLIVLYIFVGFGNGLEDAGWCAWTGNMINANRIQGFLHAFYSTGGTISPLIATAMTTKGGLPWYTFYYMMVRDES
jgi:fucose permease